MPSRTNPGLPSAHSRDRDVDGLTVVHACEEPPESYERSIFLAGPTPRSPAVPSWRPAAVSYLRSIHWSGVVFVPEPRDGVWTKDYLAQVNWEEQHLARADAILFWVPREMTTMPALTTNVEWGVWCDSGKAVLGYPPQAEHLRYLRHYADTYQVPVAVTLEETIDAAIAMAGEGSARRDGERDVPLAVWRTDSFQSWYAAQRAVGNRLESARVLWTFRVGPERRTLFSWAMKVAVHVAAEGRVKRNEFVLTRTDISTVLLYRPGADLDSTEVVLVREFRSPVRNSTGLVSELPGGSSFAPGVDARGVAVAELQEETGLALPPDRFRPGRSRQLAATFSAHRAHPFVVLLTEQEMATMRTREHDGFVGGADPTERTTVQVRTVGQLRSGDDVDFTTLGIILAELG